MVGAAVVWLPTFRIGRRRRTRLQSWDALYCAGDPHAFTNLLSEVIAPSRWFS